ncbi:dimethylaniline monooxygenase 2 [Phaeosphaeriaceae sp. PMI808]|nr:dimethylaniline monooxygenase 2 [Phaeosphaeriaceae sp. PMI808]
MIMSKPTTVAVIGLGAAGLVALKNLKEEGFEVTGFDRNSFIGGLWKYSGNDETSVLESTVVNISKERGCFSDFPFPKPMSSYPTGAQVHEYLMSYAEHFKLKPYMQLNTPIQQIRFDDKRQQWSIKTQDHPEKHFDKVVVAIGGKIGLPNIPSIEGIENFQGTSIHSQAYKRPQDFANKRVMVVGFGNSAADTATQLADIADKVYLAHRHGARILPRIMNGAPIDHTHSLRLFTVQSLILKYFPRLGEKVFDNFMKGLQDKSFKLRPEWGFEPTQKLPIVSDTLVDYLETGSIESVKGVKRILNATQVELADGSKVDVDALIWCTGYTPDFSIIDPRFDPSASSPEWHAAPGSNGHPFFRLYQNVFSTMKPDSLAFLGNVHLALGGFQVFDMASMAISQVWKGVSKLPLKMEMERDVDEYLVWLTEMANQGSNVSSGSVDAGTWTRAMDDLGGTGVNEYLGYGWKGWWFWVRNIRLCNLLMGGIWSPHIYRVFEGKRKKWDGAKEAIEAVNEAVAANKRKSKDKIV